MSTVSHEGPEVLAFTLGVTVFLASLTAPLVHTIVAQHRLPSISLAHLEEADAALLAGNLSEAASGYRVAAAIAPDDDVATYRLGVALQQASDHEGAAAAYRRTLSLDPAHVQAHYNLALAYAERGSLVRAIEHNRIVLRLDPGNAQAHTNLAAVLLRNGRPRDAIGHFEAALRLRPAFAPAMRGLTAARATAAAGTRATDRGRR